VPPTTALGIQAFWGRDLSRGSDRNTHAGIVDVFGERTLDILKKRTRSFARGGRHWPRTHGKNPAGWEEHQAVAEILSFLHSYGMSSNLALKIYQTYGNDAVRKLRDNPYRLAMDIRGMGFLARTKSRRPPVSRTMRRNAFKQACCICGGGLWERALVYPFDTLTEEALELLGIDDAAMIRQAVVALCKDNAGPKVAHVVADKLPEGDKAVYLKRLYKAETSTAEHLSGLLSTGKSLRKMNPAEEAKQYEIDTKFELAPKQREAVEMALQGGVTVLTGGPGTAKPPPFAPSSTRCVGTKSR